MNHIWREQMDELVDYLKTSTHRLSKEVSRVDDVGNTLKYARAHTLSLSLFLSLSLSLARALSLSFLHALFLFLSLSFSLSLSLSRGGVTR